MPPRKGRRAPSKKAADFWPASLAHLREPFLADGDEHVVIAEICGEAVNGYAGMRQVYTCLVPLDEIDAVLSSPGGIGWHVESWGPLPVVGPQGGWDGSFWVEGAAGSGRKYEALVHAWTHHDRTVMAPDNSLLMCYGLVPRILDKERILWDDPSKPVYDVLEVKPLSTYVMPDTHPHAYVRVRRDYLEDYASLKGCGVVAVYYEERRSNGDQVLTDALGEDEGREFVLLGRRVAIARGTRDWLVQAWGCRLVLKPAARPVSEEDDAEDLVWPGGKMLKDFDVLESVFVRDEALQEWESRDEFSVSPKSGDVSYGGWWSTDRSMRWGRHHIRMEVRKLYEGTPAYVVRHYHRFAVSKATADVDRRQYGDRHVGDRADELVDAFLALVGSLRNLSGRLGEPFDDEEIAGTSGRHVRYHGWWMLEGFKPLGRVIPLDMTRDVFLSRCMDVYQLLERFRPGPLKRLLLGLGLTKEELKSLGEVGALRCLSTLAQLASLAKESGECLFEDFQEIKARWDKDRRLPLMAPVFALGTLRVARGHPQGADSKAKIEGALETVGLDAQAMKGGWGLGVDRVYDVMIETLNGISDLIDEQVQ